MPPQPTNQYDFIMSNSQKKRPSLSLPTSGSQGQRIAIFAGIITILLIFFIFIFSLMGKGGENKDQFAKVVQQQTEIMRVAGLASTDASTTQNTKNVSANTQVAVSSDKQLLLTTLANIKIKLKGKQLTGLPNPATDKRLADAKAAANFDATLITVLDEQLSDYQQTLQQTFDQTKSKTAKTTLTKAYQTSEALRKQVETTKP